MPTSDVSPEVTDLRHRRREIRRELARVRWWRRLVQARKDLAIAQLTDVQELERLGVDDAWEALAADAPTTSELAGAVWPEKRTATPTSVEALVSLDARLKSYEDRVGDNLEMVTAQMVRALGHERRVGPHGRGGDHG
ncbi:hypothetical protein Dac01nite_17370 [Demequina activiva]|uniref:Uncharacterized protein n=1 Tax=Demequina activiva TaxID=1582364 RepID=A0A919UKH8_9MICO|nr:hypothetical protein Dac01nite_17370 [Demequina activiva]